MVKLKCKETRAASQACHFHVFIPIFTSPSSYPTFVSLLIFILRTELLQRTTRRCISSVNGSNRRLKRFLAFLNFIESLVLKPKCAAVFGIEGQFNMEQQVADQGSSTRFNAYLFNQMLRVSVLY